MHRELENTIRKIMMFEVLLNKFFSLIDNRIIFKIVEDKEETKQ